MAGLYAALKGSFQTEPVDELLLGFDGIAGDFHAGQTRRSGGREPWYPRGTEIRNERQLSIVRRDELAIVAERMGLAELKPEWIGANLMPRRPAQPVDAACRHAAVLQGRRDAQDRWPEQAVPLCRPVDRGECRRCRTARLARSLFPKSAKRLRGLVAWVEKPGRIVPGEEISVRVPEQWIYTA